MARIRESFDSTEEGAEFVPAVLARTVDEAEVYQDLLDDHDIPAILGTDEDLEEMDDEDRRLARHRGLTHGVPVLVPETLLDEASEVISDREASEALHEHEDEDEFDGEDDEELELANREGFGLEDEETFDEDDDLYEDTEEDG